MFIRSRAAIVAEKEHSAESRHDFISNPAVASRGYKQKIS